MANHVDNYITFEGNEAAEKSGIIYSHTTAN